MSKSPNKKNKNITEYQVKVLQEWLFLMKVLDGATDKLLNNTFAELKTNLADKTMLAINNDTRLTRYDENMYNYYKHLMTYYSRTVEMYSENKDSIKSFKIKNIFDGIYSVILSRLKLFDENYGNSEGNLGVNPITIEKNQIIHSNIKLFNKNFDMLKNKFTNEHLHECIILARQNFYEKVSYKNIEYVGVQFIAIIQDCLCDTLYKIYEMSIKNTINSLNDLQLRKVTAYYHDMLKEEQEILTSIIKIQITALEHEIEENESSVEEKTILFNMLSNLREGHQHLGKEISEIMNFFDTDTGMSTIVVEPYQEFADEFSGSFEIEKVFPLTLFDEEYRNYAEKEKIFNQSFTDLVKLFLDKQLNTFNIDKAIYETKKSIAENAFMAVELINLFKTIAEETNIPEGLPKEATDIMKGIDETIGIKIETMEEAREEFVKDANQTLATFDKNAVKFNQDDIDLAIQNAFEIWMEEMINCPKKEDEAMVTVEKVFKELLKCESLYNYHEQISKKHVYVVETIAKKILSYKRDYLLYEISTFEEIMNYSVSKLRESEDEQVKLYVDFIDKKTLSLETILKRNNVELIRPLPHETFNAKEHEVLMAEKNEEFLKGEIIKVMNSGYRQNGTVILRANVIAAK